LSFQFADMNDKLQAIVFLLLLLFFGFTSIFMATVPGSDSQSL